MFNDLISMAANLTTIFMTISAILGAGISIIVAFFRRDYNTKQEKLLEMLEKLSDENVKLKEEENEEDRFYKVKTSLIQYNLRLNEIKDVEMQNLIIRNYFLTLGRAMIILWGVSVLVTMCIVIINTGQIFVLIIILIFLFYVFQRYLINMIDNIIPYNDANKCPSMQELLKIDNEIKIDGTEIVWNLPLRFFQNGSVIEVYNKGEARPIVMQIDSRINTAAFMKFINGFQFQGELCFIYAGDDEEKFLIDQNKGTVSEGMRYIYFKLNHTREDIKYITLRIIKDGDEIRLHYSNNEECVNKFILRNSSKFTSAKFIPIDQVIREFEESK